LTLIPCYFPHSGYKETELDSFVEKFSLFYSTSAQAKNATIIIGADISASIGTRNSGSEHSNPSAIWSSSPPYQVIEKQYIPTTGLNSNTITKKNSIEYTTGVQQGDNMPPILFLFVMQAFIDTPSSNFCYFPEHKLQISHWRSN
jgi:hypothetical protein